MISLKSLTKDLRDYSAYSNIFWCFGKRNENPLDISDLSDIGRWNPLVHIIENLISKVHPHASVRPLPDGV